jgi:hypothetical protein
LEPLREVRPEVVVVEEVWDERVLCDLGNCCICSLPVKFRTVASKLDLDASRSAIRRAESNEVDAGAAAAE